MAKGSSEVDAARLLPKLADLVHDSMQQTAAASEAMEQRRTSLEMASLATRIQEAGACRCMFTPAPSPINQSIHAVSAWVCSPCLVPFLQNC